MIYEITHVQQHTCYLIIKKQLFGEKIFKDVFGDEAERFERYVKEQFEDFEKNVLGHDCYFIAYDCANDEDPFEQYLNEYMIDKGLDEEDSIEEEKTYDNLQSQLDILEDNGFVCVSL